ncbi:MAG: hypothetical protein LBV77_01835 [Candidatus Adiutrix intracellularis]|nr:hypothetical protein [Candidatus Adiutrix intracellularis]
MVSVKTAWVKSLFEPIIGGQAEYVAPMYVWKKNEAPLTRLLVYPLMRTLFGRRVLQPVGIDHAVSNRLIEIYKNENWETDDLGYKSDLKMLYLAIINQAHICQSLMRYPRIFGQGDKWGDDLPRALACVVNAIFDLMTTTDNFWKKIIRSRPTALFGMGQPLLTQSSQQKVDPTSLTRNFVESGQKYRKLWERYFPPDLAEGLNSELTAAIHGALPRINVNLWRRSLYEASATYRFADATTKSALVKALTPIFSAKYFSTIENSRNFDERQLNALVESEALNFEKNKKELLDLWA